MPEVHLRLTAQRQETRGFLRRRSCTGSMCPCRSSTVTLREPISNVGRTGPSKDKKGYGVKESDTLPSYTYKERRSTEKGRRPMRRKTHIAKSKSGKGRRNGGLIVKNEETIVESSFLEPE